MIRVCHIENIPYNEGMIRVCHIENIPHNDYVKQIGHTFTTLFYFTSMYASLFTAVLS